MRQPPCGAHTETETSFLRKKIAIFFSFHYQHGLVVTVCEPARKEKRCWWFKSALCRALGFMLFQGRFENPPVIKTREGGSEPHTPGTGKAAGPRARGAKGSSSAAVVCREPTGMQSLISWKPRAVEVANICTEAGKVPRNQDRGVKLDKGRRTKAGQSSAPPCWCLVSALCVAGAGADSSPGTNPCPALPASPDPT